MLQCSKLPTTAWPLQREDAGSSRHMVISETSSVPSSGTSRQTPAAQCFSKSPVSISREAQHATMLCINTEGFTFG